MGYSLTPNRTSLSLSETTLERQKPTWWQVVRPHVETDWWKYPRSGKNVAWIWDTKGSVLWLEMVFGRGGLFICPWGEATLGGICGPIDPSDLTGAEWYVIAGRQNTTVSEWYLQSWLYATREVASEIARMISVTIKEMAPDTTYIVMNYRTLETV